MKGLDKVMQSMDLEKVKVALCGSTSFMQIPILLLGFPIIRLPHEVLGPDYSDNISLSDI